MTRMAKYHQERKRKFLAMLDVLYQEVKSGRVTVEEYGIWDSRMNNRINFKFHGLSRDSDKLIKKLEQFQ